MLCRQFNLARPLTGLAAQSIDHAPVGNRDEPRSERPAGIVGMTNHREWSKEHILDRVFHVDSSLEASCGNRSDIRLDVLEERAIGLTIAVLCPRHQLRPVELTARIPRVAFPRRGDERESRRMRLLANRHSSDLFPTRSGCGTRR